MSDYQIEQTMQRLGCERIQAINHLRGLQTLRRVAEEEQKRRVAACFAAWQQGAKEQDRA